MSKRSNFIGRLGLAKIVCFACLASILFFFDPARASFYPRCLFHEITGLPCNGCGLLRSAYCLLHGDVRNAVAFNPLVVLALPLLIAFVIKPSLAKSPVVIALAVAISFAFFTARIIGYFPVPTI